MVGHAQGIESDTWMWGIVALIRSPTRLSWQICHPWDMWVCFINLFWWMKLQYTSLLGSIPPGICIMEYIFEIILNLQQWMKNTETWCRHEVMVPLHENDIADEKNTLWSNFGRTSPSTAQVTLYVTIVHEFLLTCTSKVVLIFLHNDDLSASFPHDFTLYMVKRKWDNETAHVKYYASFLAEHDWKLWHANIQQSSIQRDE